MKRKPQIIIGIILIVIFVLLAVAAPLLAPNDPNATDLALKNALPSVEFRLVATKWEDVNYLCLLYTSDAADD